MFILRPKYLHGKDFDKKLNNKYDYERIETRSIIVHTSSTFTFV